MYDIMYGDTTQNSLIKGCNNLLVLLKGGAYQTTQCTAVLLGDDHIM